MNDIDVIVAHPLKHHVFPLAAGIQSSGANVKLIVPFYRKGLGRIVALSPGAVGQKSAGYYYNELISDSVVSPFAWQLRKLLWANDAVRLANSFDAYVAKKIISGHFRAKVLVTMQDYMPKTVAAGKNAGMLIWSDQISNSGLDATKRISSHYESVNLKFVHNESVNNAILSIADLVTVPSQYAHSGLAGRVNPHAQLHIIPYGVDGNKFNVRKQKSTDSIRVIARANSVRKGGHLLLRALSVCGDELLSLVEGRKIEIVIIGSLELGLSDMLSRTKFSRRITVRSSIVPHKLMPSMLASADLFVMPSLSESMSLICIEAMQARLPLIITAECGLDCFEHMRMGLKTKDSVVGLTESLLMAFSDFKKWPEWGQRASVAAAKLGWNVYAEGISGITSNFLRH